MPSSHPAPASSTQITAQGDAGGEKPRRGTVIEVQILGQVFSVSSEDSEEHVRQVAALVDQRIRQVISQGKAVAPFTAAVITALNIASEYQKLKEQNETISSAIARLMARIEQLAADG